MWCRWYTLYINIQSNFNGSNTFGTMKTYLRQGLFKLVTVNHRARSGGKIWISFRFLNFFNMKVFYVLSLESPHLGDSNKYGQYTILIWKRKPPIFIQSFDYAIFSKGLENEFRTALVKEPSVFEPLKVYCNQSGKRLPLLLELNCSIPWLTAYA